MSYLLSSGFGIQWYPSHIMGVSSTYWYFFMYFRSIWLVCIKYGYMSKMEYSCNLATDNHKLATNELDRQCHKPLLYSFQCTWMVWVSNSTIVVAFHPNYKDPYSFFGQMTQIFPLSCPNLDMLYSCFSSCHIPTYSWYPQHI